MRFILVLLPQMITICSLLWHLIASSAAKTASLPKPMLPLITRKIGTSDGRCNLVLAAALAVLVQKACRTGMPNGSSLFSGITTFCKFIGQIIVWNNIIIHICLFPEWDTGVVGSHSDGRDMKQIFSLHAAQGLSRVQMRCDDSIKAV